MRVAIEIGNRATESVQKSEKKMQNPAYAVSQPFPGHDLYRK